MPDKRNDLLFAGYQAQGTLGREIQSGSHTVDIDNQPIEANAQIHTISGYSAHSDQSDLLKFVTGVPTQPKAMHLIHGEKEAKKELGEMLEAEGVAVVY
uniref:RNA-metabolising metallo-beta-lactamase family protein n=1 Tax=Vibrio parahaemolyticus TaxID=670 RepID=A0A5P4S6S7_VIBPH|nr:RNA-metabolising metallo-beta-lactamase family protein [Vibrio parahaemolyticus]